MTATRVVFCYTGDFSYPEKILESFRTEFPSVEFTEMSGSDWSQGDLRDTVVFMGWPSDEMLSAMPRLRWLQLPSAGADRFTKNPLVADDVVITCSRGVFGPSGGEQAMAFVYAFARQLHIHFEQKSRKVWKRNPTSLSVEGSTMGVIGMGSIGSETAKRAKGAGMTVLAVKRSAGDKPVFVDELYGPEGIDTVISRADFLVLSLPGTEETRGIMSEERIAMMKPGAVFINLGRGSSVNEPALIEALRSGRLVGAGLDVTSREPLPPENPLWELANVMITSHSVGVAPLKPERRASLFTDNLRRFLGGEKLRGIVDRTLGY